MERYPAVIEAGRGVDAAYAAWYEHVLELTAPEGLLIMYGYLHDPARDGVRAVGVERHIEISLPPPFIASGSDE